MMILSKGEHTRFEGSVIQLRAVTVLFELVQTLQGVEHDENIYQTLVEDLLNRYRALCGDLEAVFASLRSDKPSAALQAPEGYSDSMDVLQLL